MRHIFVPSAWWPVREITNSRLSGRMAIEREPVGENTKVYPWSQSAGNDARSLERPGSPCQRIGSP